MDLDSVRDLQEKLSHLYHEIDAWLGDDAIPDSVDQAATVLQQRLGFPTDLVHRTISGPAGLRAELLFVNGAANDSLIEELVHHLGHSRRVSRWPSTRFPVGPVTAASTVSALVDGIVGGKAAVGLSSGGGWWIVDTAARPPRSPQEPSSETVIHGPHLGFIEDFDTNVALLRQFLPTADLRVEVVTIGTDVPARAGIVSLRNAARSAVLREVKRRLQRVTVEGLIDTTTLQSYLGSRRVLPTVQVSERPDEVAASILEGRVAILTDRSPVVLIVPAVLTNLLTMPGDYYQTAAAGTFTRILRYAGILAALVLPAFYVGVLNVTQALIPLTLWLSIIRARILIPFTIMVETLGMLLAFDIVTEAGQQIPGALGQTITVVGGLFIGSAAIRAGIVSAPTVIVVAASYMGQFLIPSLDLASVVRILRYPLILIAGVFGLFGVTASLVALVGLAGQVNSYGVPYLWPLTMAKPRVSFRDTIARFPVTMRRRPARAR